MWVASIKLILRQRLDTLTNECFELKTHLSGRKTDPAVAGRSRAVPARASGGHQELPVAGLIEVAGGLRL